MPAPAATTGPPLSPSLRAWRWRVFVSTWLCYAGLYFCRKPFYIVKKPLGEALHLDAAALGDLGAAYLVCYAVGQALAGAVGTRLGPRLVLLAGMVTSIACTVALGVVGSAGSLLLLLSLNGLAQASGWSNCIGTMAAWFHRRERGRVMGLWATNFQVGGVLANALAAFVLTLADWRAALLAGAGVLFAVWLVVLAWQRDRPEDVGLPPLSDHEGDEGDEEVPDDPAPRAVSQSSGRLPRTLLTNIALLGTFYFFAKFIRYALWSWAPYFFARSFGLEPGKAGYLSTLFDLCGVPGVVVTGFLSDRFFGARRAGVSLLMLVLMTASTVGLYVLGRHSVPVFAASICVIGFTLYGPDALLTSAAAMDIGTRRHATLAAGLISFLGSLGSVVQELVIGRLYNERTGELGTVFLLLLGSSVMCTLTLAVVVVRNRLGRSRV